MAPGPPLQSAQPVTNTLLWRRLLVILTFFLFVWSFLAFVRSDFFRLREIEIAGARYTGEQEILQALGNVRGHNIWQLNPALLSKEVESIARVKEVSIHRRLPGTLLVEVLEKESLFLVPYGEYLLELCADGQVVGTTRDPQYFGLPLLTGLAPLHGAVGEYLLEGRSLHLVLCALRALDSHGVPVSELNLADPANLVLVTMDGLAVWLGDCEFDAKADLVSQIRLQLQGKAGNGYLDLRVKDLPVYNLVDNTGN
jgi:cell division protein FtsQ